MSRRLLIPMLVAAALLPRTASAQNCLDQNAPTNNACMAGFGQVDLAQSFKQTDDTVTGAGIYMIAGAGSPETLTISLWNALPNAGGSQLASGTGLASPGAWFDVTWPAVSVTPGTTYYLVFSSTASMCYAGDVFNGYPHGNVFANPGYNSFPGYDYTFRTFNLCGPSLSKTGSCPGAITLSVADCTPAGSVAILHGLPGSFVYGGNPCPGIVLDLSSPTFGALLTANASGAASLSFNAPPGACGRLVQAVDVASCTTTNVLVL